MLKLPGLERAHIGPEKIRDYLLSAEHPVGRFKAAWFSSGGYSRQHWDRLRRDLLAFSQLNEAIETERNDFGQKYEVRGHLVGPSGRTLSIVAIWIVVNNEDFPRLVTAFPGEEQQ